MTLKEANQITTDHLGNKYSSFEDMCQEYNIKPVLVATRLRNGATIEEALTRSSHNRGKLPPNRGDL